MDFLNKLNTNASNSFGENMMNNENIINIICGVLLILLIIIVVYCLCRNGEGFSNKKVKDDSDTDSISDPVTGPITLLLVSRKGCGFAKGAEDLFKSKGMKLGKHNVEIMDISEVGNKLGKDYESRIQGTPALVNRKNGKVSMGLKSIEDYLKDLFENEESDDTKSNDSNNKEHNKELDILVVGYMGCPFCRKMKQFLDNKIGEKNYKFIESNSDEGKRHMSKYKANGVPLVINAKNGRYINGYSEDLSQLM